MALELTRAAAAVAALGGSSAEFNSLSDAQVLAARGPIADLLRLSNTVAALLAGTIAKRSRPELGQSGLAARHGFGNPTLMVQQATGLSRVEAGRLLAVGVLMNETESAERRVAEADREAERATQAAVDAAAEAIAEAAREAEREAARWAAREAERAAAWTQLHPDLPLPAAVPGPVVPVAPVLPSAPVAPPAVVVPWQAPIMHAVMAPEQGEMWIATYDALTSPRRGGVRFVDPERTKWAHSVKDDPRTVAQNTDETPTDTRADSATGSATGGEASRMTEPRVSTPTTPSQEPSITHPVFGYIEGNPAPISAQSIDRHLCDTGYLGILFSHTGQPLNVGRDQRLFNREQPRALTARDGGCRWPGCEQPPAWTESHHIENWSDQGLSNIDHAILL